MSGISKRVSGSWVSGNYGIMGTSTNTITTLPTIIYPNDTTATVGLKGNMSQTGAPTPDNPIMPQGTGEITGNLYNLNAVDTAKGYVENYRLNSGNPDAAVGNFITEYIAVIPDSTYTISGFTAGWSSSVVWYDSTFAKIGYQLYENKSVNTFTVPSNAKYVRFTGAMNKKDTTMFNLGSTAKPYEPYGYKIPISSANTTTPVYLGEVESTRRIKKLVLTGDETCFNYSFQSTNGIEMINMLDANYQGTNGICSHYPVATTSSANSLWIGVNNKTLYFVGILDDIGLSSPTAFKQWLATQYAAGTPVTVWYVLATETTGVVNEPLMKIGDYADTVSGITIPTITGANSFDVLTTLKPSEVSLSYTGWHDASVKEWDGSDWQ